MPRPDPFHPGDEVLTALEASQMIGVHYQTILDWIKDGRLRARRKGRSFEIRKSVLAEFDSRASALADRVDAIVRSARASA